ncbi:hypothetical protein AL049_08880 [Pseudomonas syringae pv. cerasicola]|nr:hypothetical protein AL049_08880 [Pseudomonas syringae pv. cerasicola]PHN81613.1 hypothetical protein AO272_17860 [Pseudomonas syringae pv. cerasicola]PHN82750.1 hypothetical protein AO252_21130 [Pseudomonas syringae pv. cerasicola]
MSQLRQDLPYEGSYTQASSRLSRNIAPASCDVKLERPAPSESLCTGRFFWQKMLCWACIGLYEVVIRPDMQIIGSAMNMLIMAK